MPDPAPISEDERAELVAYLDGELAAAATERVESRLRDDPRIRAEVDAYRRTWDLLDRLPPAPASPTFASRTLDQLAVSLPSHEIAKRSWPAARTWGWAAALLA